MPSEFKDFAIANRIFSGIFDKRKNTVMEKPQKFLLGNTGINTQFLWRFAVGLGF